MRQRAAKEMEKLAAHMAFYSPGRRNWQAARQGRRIKNLALRLPFFRAS
jgi:hypothetical protein